MISVNDRDKISTIDTTWSQNLQASNYGETIHHLNT